MLSTVLTYQSLPTSESCLQSDFTRLEAKQQKGDADAASVSKCRLCRKIHLTLFIRLLSSQYVEDRPGTLVFDLLLLYIYIFFKSEPKILQPFNRKKTMLLMTLLEPLFIDLSKWNHCFPGKLHKWFLWLPHCEENDRCIVRSLSEFPACSTMYQPSGAH